MGEGSDNTSVALKRKISMNGCSIKRPDWSLKNYRDKTQRMPDLELKKYSAFEVLVVNHVMSHTEVVSADTSDRRFVSLSQLQKI